KAPPRAGPGNGSRPPARGAAGGRPPLRRRRHRAVPRPRAGHRVPDLRRSLVAVRRRRVRRRVVLVRPRASPLARDHARGGGPRAATGRCHDRAHRPARSLRVAPGTVARARGVARLPPPSPLALLAPPLPPPP